MFFFFKQKTAYELRISDWSSDVCSSDLTAVTARNKPQHPGVMRRRRKIDSRGFGKAVRMRMIMADHPLRRPAQLPLHPEMNDGVKQIRSAACRERGWQYV